MAKSKELLKKMLHERDGRGYPAYKDLKGDWDFKEYVLGIDHVQSDPFASPSSLSIHLANSDLPKHLYEKKKMRIMSQDILLSHFNEELTSQKGLKKARDIYSAFTTPEILERSACQIDPKTGAITLHIKVQFPGKGRRIWVAPLLDTLFRELPALVLKTLFFPTMPKGLQDQLEEGYQLACNQEALRKQMEEQHLVAFVANGAILPRQSGESSLPMENSTPFISPDQNEITLSLPYPIQEKNEISGMAIPEGITLIVGGGYHGKSTLLQALEMGVYDHRLGDGREYVLTREDSVKIRSEDGRAVHHEDISNFIRNLPNKKSTKDFLSEDASGSTSQATNVVEALEAGSKMLLIDEDTSATNFMIRDDLMQSVVSLEEEPIIPYISRIKELFENGISTILVAGSSGAYIEKADLVLQMKEYKPYNITKEAKEKVTKLLASRKEAHFQELPAFQNQPERIVLKNPKLLADKVKVKAPTITSLSIAKENVALWALEQLVDNQQTTTIGKMILFAQRHLIDNQRSLEEVVDLLLQLQEKKGLSYFGQGYLASVRKHELMGAFNRMRSQNFKLKN